MPQYDQLTGTSARMQLPDVLKAVMELCPHGLMLRSGDDVLYSNAAWKRLRDGVEESSESSTSPSKHLREDCFSVTLEDHPVEVSIIQDVTARAQLEVQLREAQKLEALGRWVGSIVHDFRNVLTAVMLYSDLLAQTAEPGSVAAKYNGEVKEAAKRGTDLVGQLLSFARQREPEVTVVSLNSLLNGVRDVLHRMTGEDIDLIFDLCAAPCRARVDATQIQQVVFNLAVNSRQAMPEGGRIVVRTREIVDTADPGASGAGWIELVVSDDGLGMDAATLTRAFEPFFTTKPKGKGTGLGLTTVQSIVSQYGGSVSIESKPAKGTTVRVLLPRVDAAQCDVPTDVSANVPVGSETVLLVEDDAAVRASIREMLSHLGYRVLEASAGLDAIRAAESFEGPIDLLLADMVLPGLSGREIARRIKLGRPDLPILFISGYEPVREGDGPDIFSKPFTKQALAHKVREVLDSSGPGLNRARLTSVQAPG
jgi:two-component system cell cycle sensor histidine kinase/response regulator CckA